MLMSIMINSLRKIATPIAVKRNPRMLITLMIVGNSPQHKPMKDAKQVHRVNENANTTKPVFYVCDIIILHIL